MLHKFTLAEKTAIDNGIVTEQDILDYRDESRAELDTVYYKTTTDYSFLTIEDMESERNPMYDYDVDDLPLINC